MKKLLLISAIVTLFYCLAVQAQPPEVKKVMNDPKIVQKFRFESPDGYMPMEWKGFSGALMLDSKRPSGIFFSRPDDNETPEALQVRANKTIAKMFLHDDKKVDEITWQNKDIPAHKGDKGPTAVMNTYDGDTDAIQITYYQFGFKGVTYLYGYFARKSKTSKDKNSSADFLDDQGKGVKKFDQFWKSLPLASK